MKDAALTIVLKLIHSRIGQIAAWVVGLFPVAWLNLTGEELGGFVESLMHVVSVLLLGLVAWLGTRFTAKAQAAHGLVSDGWAGPQTRGVVARENPAKRRNDPPFGPRGRRAGAMVPEAGYLIAGLSCFAGAWLLVALWCWLAGR